MEKLPERNRRLTFFALSSDPAAFTFAGLVEKRMWRIGKYPSDVEWFENHTLLEIALASSSVPHDDIEVFVDRNYPEVRKIISLLKRHFPTVKWTRFSENAEENYILDDSYEKLCDW
jgi:hypothetical protein